MTKKSMLSNKNCNNFNSHLVDRPIDVVADDVHGKEAPVHDGNADRPEIQQKSVIEIQKSDVELPKSVVEKQTSVLEISDKITNTSICPQYCRHGHWRYLDSADVVSAIYP